MGVDSNGRKRRDRQRVKHRGPDPGMTFEISLCMPAFILFNSMLFSGECVWSVDVIERNQVKAGLGGGRLGSLPAVFCHGAVPTFSFHFL